MGSRTFETNEYTKVVDNRRSSNFNEAKYSSKSIELAKTVKAKAERNIAAIEAAKLEEAQSSELVIRDKRSSAISRPIPDASKDLVLKEDALTGTLGVNKKEFYDTECVSDAYSSDALTAKVVASVFMTPIGVVPGVLMFDGSLLATAGSMLAILGIGCGGLMAAYFGKGKKALDEQSKVDHQLAVWIKTRYNIEVHSPHIKNIRSLLRVQKRYGKYNFSAQVGDTVEFSDVNDKVYMAVIGEDRELYISEKNYALPAPIGAAQYKSDITSESASISLSGEAVLIYKSIMSRLEKLEAMGLIAENKHVVSRVREDLAKALSVHEKMLMLNDSQESNSALVDILASLNAELNDILEMELINLQKELDIQRSYVKDRRVEVTSMDSKTALVDLENE